jgi:hypothetical protein
MFFIGIFGVEDKQKEVRTIRNLSCKNCDGFSGLTLFKQYTFFYLFFIPIFKWNIRYYLLCNTCNILYQISTEKGIRAEQGDDTAITYWDLKSEEIQYSEDYHYNKCKNCGKVIDVKFDYCPYCGKKRE